MEHSSPSSHHPPWCQTRVPSFCRCRIGAGLNGKLPCPLLERLFRHWHSASQTIILFCGTQKSFYLFFFFFDLGKCVHVWSNGLFKEWQLLNPDHFLLILYFSPTTQNYHLWVSSCFLIISPLWYSVTWSLCFVGIWLFIFTTKFGN